jgi:hypothetical protein
MDIQKYQQFLKILVNHCTQDENDKLYKQLIFAIENDYVDWDGVIKLFTCDHVDSLIKIK